MRQILAIAKLTVKAAFRFRIVIALSLFLICAVTALPLLLKDDGTARGFAQILLTYSLGLTITTLAFATLWMSCGLLAQDIENCRIQLVVVKPIARWKIWFGKWLGMMLVNVILLSLSGGVIYGLLQYRASKLNGDQKYILKNEVFVARGSVKEPPPTQEIEAAVEQSLQERLRQSEFSETLDRAGMRKQITELIKHQYQLVPEAMMRVWTVPFGSVATSLKDNPLYVRTKFIAMSHTSTFDDERSFPMLWEFGPMDTPQSWRTVVMMTPNTVHEIPIPPGLISEDGNLEIRFMNNQDETFFFDLNDGLEVLYRQGGFLPNYIRGLLILLCWLGLLAAIGLAASSFLSFPVASFFAISVLILGLSTGTMSQVIEEGGVYGVDHETGKIAKRSIVDKVTVIVFSELKSLIELVQNFSPVELLSEGRTITWTSICSAIFQIIIIVGGIFAAGGIYFFTRRELALVKGGQN